MYIYGWLSFLLRLNLWVIMFFFWWLYFDWGVKFVIVCLYIWWCMFVRIILIIIYVDVINFDKFGMVVRVSFIFIVLFLVIKKIDSFVKVKLIYDRF